DTSSTSATGYTVHDGTVGVSADATSFKFASITSGATTYNGLQVEGLNGALVGVPTVTIQVKGVEALANSVTPTTATKLNFGAVADLPFAFATALTANVNLHLAGAVALSAADLVAATTDHFTVDHLTVSEGDAWAFSLTSPHVFVGVAAGLDVSSTSASGYT